MGKNMEKPKRLVDQRLLTPEQLAEKMGWKLGSLFSQRSRGNGPPWIKIGRQVRYPEDDLNKWLEEIQREVA